MEKDAATASATAAATTQANEFSSSNLAASSARGDDCLSTDLDAIHAALPQHPPPSSYDTAYLICTVYLLI